MSMQSFQFRKITSRLGDRPLGVLVLTTTGLLATVALLAFPSGNAQQSAAQLAMGLSDFHQRAPDIGERFAASEMPGLSASRASTAASSPGNSKLLSPSPRSEFRYAIGDRVKISIYEQVQSAGARTAAGEAVAFIERSELSGEYVVQVGGEVLMPILGAIRIAGGTAAQVNDELLHKAREMLGGALSLSVQLLEREPVYVLGLPSDGGSYKYSPGMVVAQLVARAAGASGGSADLWKQIDIARERERLSKAAERMKRSLAIIDVLTAEQQGAPEKASARLQQIAGEQAAELLREQSAARRLLLERQRAQDEDRDKQIMTVSSDLDVMRSRLNEMSSIVAERVKRSEALTTRFRQGTSTEVMVVQAQREVVEIKSAWHELRSGIARLEMRLLELTRERDQSAHAWRIDFDSQLRAARQAVSEDEVTLATIGQLLLSIGNDAGRPISRLAFTIVRRTPSGMQEFPAEPLTPLEPGDVLRVAEGPGMQKTK